MPFGRAKAMKDVIWDETYNIGIEEIDRQHMEFIKLLRRFNFGIEKTAALTVQFRILHELLKYAEYHFASEENIMFFTKYPEFAAQQSEHKRILSWLGRRVDAYKRAPDNGERLSNFLYAWFVDHTQVEDRKIAAHVGNGKMYSDLGMSVEASRS
jgi:hemerythrin